MAGAPTPIHSLRRRVQVLERELLYVRRQMDVLVRRSSVGRNNKAEVFLAKTAEDSSYPTAPANVFGIIFCTAAFTRAEGQQSPTYTDHSANVQEFALSSAGWIPKDTYVLVKRQRNGQYIIIQNLGEAVSLGKVSASSIAAGSTGQVTRYTDSWTITSPAETITVKNYHGVDLPLGLRVRWFNVLDWDYPVVEPFEYTECPT